MEKYEVNKFIEDTKIRLNDIYNALCIKDKLPIKNGDNTLYSYVLDDSNKLANKDVCYKGRLPKYDNEIAVSGKYAKEVGYKIGDEVTLNYGVGTYTYLITGFVQSTNNGGHEAILEVESFTHLADMTNFPGYFWFDVDGGIDVTNNILNDIKTIYGEHITSTMNFDEIVTGSLSVFKVISWGMMILIVGITIGIIVLVLYLLMKNMIFEKRFEYGVLKSIGYTSKDLMIQNALSFMPSIILGTIASLVISSILVSPYITLVMSAFGIMHANMSIPILGVIIFGIGQIAISFVIAYLLSGRIKKIEPYNLLIGE